MKFGFAPGASAKVMDPEGCVVTVAKADGPASATPTSTSAAMARRRECPTCIEDSSPCHQEWS